MKKIILILLVFLTTTFSFSNVNYNIFVKLDQEAEKSVSHISEGLKKEVGLDSLYSQGYVIHLTLYLTEYEKDKLEDLKRVVDEVASKAKPFEIEFKKVFKTGSNWFMLDNDKHPTLQSLSDEVVHLASKYRAKDAVIPGWAKNIPNKVKAFNSYGSPNVFLEFNPHVTLMVGRPEISDKLDKFLEVYKFSPFKSKVIAMGIAEVDNSGQAKDIKYMVEFK